MARITVRFSSFPLSGTMRDVFPRAAQIVDGYGRLALSDIQNSIWARSRFIRSTGNSTAAWKVLVDKDRLHVIWRNYATNRYGTKYARYIHLAGKPRSDKLLFEAQAHIDNVIGSKILSALGLEFIAGQKTRRTVTSQTFGGR